MSKKFTLRTPRRLIQLTVFLSFIIIPILNTKEIYQLVGNLLGFNAFGIPLADPLSMTQAALGSAGLTQALLLGAGLSLLLALIMGPVFCSWICPFGFLSELMHPAPDLEIKTTRKAVDPKPFVARCIIAGLGLLGVMSFIPYPILNQVSMPGWITRFWQSAFILKEILWIGLLLPAVILILERITKKRFWCRYLCPQSVLISLAGLIAPKRFQVAFTRQKCTCPASDQLCLKTCSLNLNPRELSLAQKAQCTNCGDCIDACKSRGQALDFSFSTTAKLKTKNHKSKEAVTEKIG